MAVSVAALAGFGSLAQAQNSISVPLSGTLPARCSIRTHSVTISESPPPASITVVVFHSCNARNNLVVRVRPGTGPADVTFNATYDLKAPSANTLDSATFFQSGPIETQKKLVLRLPKGGKKEAEDLARRMQITVEAL